MEPCASPRPIVPPRAHSDAGDLPQHLDEMSWRNAGHQDLRPPQQKHARLPNHSTGPESFTVPVGQNAGRAPGLRTALARRMIPDNHRDRRRSTDHRRRPRAFCPLREEGRHSQGQRRGNPRRGTVWQTVDPQPRPEPLSRLPHLRRDPQGDVRRRLSVGGPPDAPSPRRRRGEGHSIQLATRAGAPRTGPSIRP